MSNSNFDADLETLPNTRLNLKHAKTLIEARRVKVIQLASKGMTQEEIAMKLGCTQSLISRDLTEIKAQAQREMATYITERIPYDHLRCMTGLNDLLRKAHQLMARHTDDPKLQIQMINVTMELYKAIMMMSGDGSIVEQSYKKVTEIQKRAEQRQEQQQEQESEPQEQDNHTSTESTTDETEEVESTTTAE